MVGVSKDSVKSHQKFIEKQELNFTLISDEDGKICEDYGVWQMKKIHGKRIYGNCKNYILDRSGRKNSQGISQSQRERTCR